MISCLTRLLPRRPRALFASGAAVLLQACGGPLPPAESPAVSAPVYVGAIETVDRESNTVTISASGESSALPPGTDLTAIAASGEATRLKVGANTKRPRVSATVVSGTPKRGQRVYR